MNCRRCHRRIRPADAAGLSAIYQGRMMIRHAICAICLRDLVDWLYGTAPSLNHHKYPHPIEARR